MRDETAVSTYQRALPGGSAPDLGPFNDSDCPHRADGSGTASSSGNLLLRSFGLIGEDQSASVLIDGSPSSDYRILCPVVTATPSSCRRSYQSRHHRRRAPVFRSSSRRTWLGGLDEFPLERGGLASEAVERDAAALTNRPSEDCRHEAYTTDSAPCCFGDAFESDDRCFIDWLSDVSVAGGLRAEAATLVFPPCSGIAVPGESNDESSAIELDRHPSAFAATTRGSHAESRSNLEVAIPPGEGTFGIRRLSHSRLGNPRGQSSAGWRQRSKFRLSHCVRRHQHLKPIGLTSSTVSSPLLLANDRFSSAEILGFVPGPEWPRRNRHSRNHLHHGHGDNPRGDSSTFTPIHADQPCGPWSQQHPCRGHQLSCDSMGRASGDELMRERNQGFWAKDSETLGQSSNATEECSASAIPTAAARRDRGQGAGSSRATHGGRRRSRERLNSQAPVAIQSRFRRPVPFKASESATRSPATDAPLGQNHAKANTALPSPPSLLPPTLPGEGAKHVSPLPGVSRAESPASSGSVVPCSSADCTPIAIPPSARLPSVEDLTFPSSAIVRQISEEKIFAKIPANLQPITGPQAHVDRLISSRCSPPSLIATADTSISSIQKESQDEQWRLRRDVFLLAAESVHHVPDTRNGSSRSGIADQPMASNADSAASAAADYVSIHSTSAPPSTRIAPVASGSRPNTNDFAPSTTQHPTARPALGLLRHSIGTPQDSASALPCWSAISSGGSSANIPGCTRSPRVSTCRSSVATSGALHQHAAAMKRVLQTHVLLGCGQMSSRTRDRILATLDSITPNVSPMVGLNHKIGAAATLPRRPFSTATQTANWSPMVTCHTGCPDRASSGGSATYSTDRESFSQPSASASVTSAFNPATGSTTGGPRHIGVPLLLGRLKQLGRGSISATVGHSLSASLLCATEGVEAQRRADRTRLDRASMPSALNISDSTAITGAAEVHQRRHNVGCSTANCQAVRQTSEGLNFGGLQPVNVTAVKNGSQNRLNDQVNVTKNRKGKPGELSSLSTFSTRRSESLGNPSPEAQAPDYVSAVRPVREVATGAVQRVSGGTSSLETSVGSSSPEPATPAVPPTGALDARRRSSPPGLVGHRLTRVGIGSDRSADVREATRRTSNTRPVVHRELTCQTVPAHGQLAHTPPTGLVAAPQVATMGVQAKQTPGSGSINGAATSLARGRRVTSRYTHGGGSASDNMAENNASGTRGVHSGAGHYHHYYHHAGRHHHHNGGQHNSHHTGGLPANLRRIELRLARKRKTSGGPLLVAPLFVDPKTLSFNICDRYTNSAKGSRGEPGSDLGGSTVGGPQRDQSGVLPAFQSDHSAPKNSENAPKAAESAAEGCHPVATELSRQSIEPRGSGLCGTVPWGESIPLNHRQPTNRILDLFEPPDHPEQISGMEGPKETNKLHHLILTWSAMPAQYVEVAGTFINPPWEKMLPLYWCPTSKLFWIDVQEVAPRACGVHQFKFIVDGLWKCDPAYPICDDGSKHHYLNNVMVIFPTRLRMRLSTHKLRRRQSLTNNAVNATDRFRGQQVQPGGSYVRESSAGDATPTVPLGAASGVSTSFTGGPVTAGDWVSCGTADFHPTGSAGGLRSGCDSGNILVGHQGPGSPDQLQFANSGSGSHRNQHAEVAAALTDHLDEWPGDEGVSSGNLLRVPSWACRNGAPSSAGGGNSQNTVGPHSGLITVETAGSNTTPAALSNRAALESRWRRSMQRTAGVLEQDPITSQSGTIGTSAADEHLYPGPVDDRVNRTAATTGGELRRIFNGGSNGHASATPSVAEGHDTRTSELFMNSFSPRTGDGKGRIAASGSTQEHDFEVIGTPRTHVTQANEIAATGVRHPPIISGAGAATAQEARPIMVAMARQQLRQRGSHRRQPPANENRSSSPSGSGKAAGIQSRHSAPGSFLPAARSFDNGTGVGTVTRGLGSRRSQLQRSPDRTLGGDPRLYASNLSFSDAPGHSIISKFPVDGAPVRCLSHHGGRRDDGARLVAETWAARMTAWPASVTNYLHTSEVLLQLLMPSNVVKMGPDALELRTGWAMSPHPEKTHTGGADAFYVSADSTCLALADGVGEWDDLGFSPRSFADELMAGVRAVWENKQHPVHQLVRTLPPSTIARELMKLACQYPKSYGSATCCIMIFDQTRQLLGVCNLGDSGVSVLRRGKKYQMVQKFKTTELCHFFNCPFQLSRSPPVAVLAKIFGVSKVENGKGFVLPAEDLPKHATCRDIPVEEGDLLLMASDGLWDNLWDFEIRGLCNLALAPFEALILHDESLVTGADDVARAILEAASLRSLDVCSRTPFAKTYTQECGMPVFTGGKWDDITVIAAWVARKQAPKLPAITGVGRPTKTVGMPSASVPAITRNNQPPTTITTTCRSPASDIPVAVGGWSAAISDCSAVLAPHRFPYYPLSDQETDVDSDAEFAQHIERLQLKAACSPERDATPLFNGNRSPVASPRSPLSWKPPRRCSSRRRSLCSAARAVHAAYPQAPGAIFGEV